MAPMGRCIFWLTPYMREPLCAVEPLAALLNIDFPVENRASGLSCTVHPEMNVAKNVFTFGLAPLIVPYKYINLLLIGWKSWNCIKVLNFMLTGICWCKFCRTQQYRFPHRVCNRTVLPRLTECDLNIDWFSWIIWWSWWTKVIHFSCFFLAKEKSKMKSAVVQFY